VNCDSAEEKRAEGRFFAAATIFGTTRKKKDLSCCKKKSPRMRLGFKSPF
jgi:hypothetical protein